MPNYKASIAVINWFKIAAWCISLCLVALNVMRILHIPMTHDECAYYNEITQPYAAIFQFKTVSANNHILNSLCRKFFVELFSDTPFWLRFDSLLAQIAFLFFSYALCRRLFNKFSWQLCVFLLLNLQPFMFEFWGLSRGYGLALAFMLGSAYFLLRYVQDRKIMFLNASLYAAILSVYSNFTLLDYYCAIIVFMAVKPFIEKNEGKNKVAIKEWLSVSAASLLLFLLVASPIKKLMREHQLYYGGKNNVSDTLISVIKENLYTVRAPGSLYIGLLAFLVACTSILTGIYWILYILRKKAHDDVLNGVLMWVLLIAPVLAIIAQHLLLNTLYPIDRTAIFLIPLFMLSLSAWMYFLSKQYRVPSNLSFYAFTTFIVYNFLTHANISYARMWWYDKNDLVVMNRIMEATKHKQHKTKLCVYWYFVPSLNYYIETRYGNDFDYVTDMENVASGDSSFDYYYIAANGLHELPKSYIIDTTFLGNAFYLMRKKQ